MPLAHRRPSPLAQAEEGLRRIIDSNADAMVVVDSAGAIKFANPAAEELFGRAREAVVGDHFGLPLVVGETTEVDLFDGRVAEMRVVELRWEDEPAWLATLRDVTARRQAEEAARRLWRERTARELAEAERGRLEELLARAPAAILTTRGGDHRCASANPRANLVFGRALAGRPLAETLPELAGQGFLECFDQTLHQGAGHSRLELPLRLGAPGSPHSGRGPELALDVTWEPLGRNGDVDGVLCFAYDVTEHVATRRELETAMERLREEERAKDQFLAVLGHELRNPLAGIDSGLRLLEGGAAGERAEWARSMMRKQVTSLTRLLDDLLDVSAIVRGKLQLERQIVPCSEVVDAAVAAVRGRFEAREQELVVILPDEPLAVAGDPRRIGQVVANLLDNASKYSPPETTVTLCVRRDGDQVTLEVTDQGIGLEPEMGDQIFEPFFQGRPDQDTPLAGGLGIGLTLVRQLVELHGGTVAAVSPGPGRGSTFTVRLPAADPDAGSAPAAAALDRLDGRTHRVLIVDDNQDAARALAELLALAGCETATANTGAEGMAKARGQRPDAILLDLDLPDRTGYEVAEELRANPQGDDLLIIAVSGFGHEQARERSRDSGIDHHLVKPVDLDRLLGLLRQAPGAKGQARVSHHIRRETA